MLGEHELQDVGHEVELALPEVLRQELRRVERWEVLELVAQQAEGAVDEARIRLAVQVVALRVARSNNVQYMLASVLRTHTCTHEALDVCDPLTLL